MLFGGESTTKQHPFLSNHERQIDMHLRRFEGKVSLHSFRTVHCEGYRVGIPPNIAAPAFENRISRRGGCQGNDCSFDETGLTFFIVSDGNPAVDIGGIADDIAGATASQTDIQDVESSGAQRWP